MYKSIVYIFAIIVALSFAACDESDSGSNTTANASEQISSLRGSLKDVFGNRLINTKVMIYNTGGSQFEFIGESVSDKDGNYSLAFEDTPIENLSIRVDDMIHGSEGAINLTGYKDRISDDGKLDWVVNEYKDCAQQVRYYKNEANYSLEEYDYIEVYHEDQLIMILNKLESKDPIFGGNSFEGYLCEGLYEFHLYEGNDYGIYQKIIKMKDVVTDIYIEQ